MDLLEIAWDWKEFSLGFFLGCAFWHYKWAIYKRIYDWWNG